MSRLRLLGLLLASLTAAAWGGAQAVPASPANAVPSSAQRPPNELGQSKLDNAGPSAASASDMPPTAAVITIRGICPKSEAEATPSQLECKTIVTRAEFEKLANALQPRMTQQVRRQLANQYAQTLYMSEEAMKRGLDKDPRFQEMLRFARMELLKVALDRSMEEEAENIPDSEINDYFEKNSKNFEQISVLRIFIPKVRQMPQKPGASSVDDEAARKESETAMAKVAEDLHKRSAGGEDFDKLQKEAYAAAGIKAPAPPTLNPKLRRANLPASQTSVFDLKEGELAPVISDVSGFYIYKLVSRTKPTVADAKDEIRNTLRSQRLQAMRQKIQTSVSSELNQDYFGPAVPSGPTGMPGGAHAMPMNRRPAPPPAQSTQPPTAPPKE